MQKARYVSGGHELTYTEEARRHRVEGTIRLVLTVNTAGRVENPRIIEGLGYGLDEAALNKVRDMAFDPATRCGVPVASEYTISLRFVYEGPSDDAH